MLSDAAGVRLLELQSIDYSWDEINFEVAPMRQMSAKMMADSTAEYGTYDMDIEPDDIEVTDTVTLVWEIA